MDQLNDYSDGFPKESWRKEAGHAAPRERLVKVSPQSRWRLAGHTTCVMGWLEFRPNDSSRKGKGDRHQSSNALMKAIPKRQRSVAADNRAPSGSWLTSSCCTPPVTGWCLVFRWVGLCSAVLVTGRLSSLGDGVGAYRPPHNPINGLVDRLL